MLIKSLSFIAHVVTDLAIANIIDDDEHQLEGLSDGNNSILIDGEYFTQQEAEDMQSRGELYDIYYS